MMKRFLYACALILGLGTVLPALGWTLYVTNWANKAVNIHTSWAGAGWAFGKCFSCCDDHATLQPGQRIAINAGECLLTELRVDGGTSYTSSGQRYFNEFHIIGPVHTTLLAGRIGERKGSGRYTQSGEIIQRELFNATKFPAANVKIELNNVYSSVPPSWIEIPNASIEAGQSFVFDVPAFYRINRMSATINNKNVSVSLPSFLKKSYISGPPDGSNPQFIEFEQ